MTNQAGVHLRVLQHEATRGNCTPPGWDCQSIAGLPHSMKFAGTHLYTWVERGTVRVKGLAQEHNAMNPARVWTQTARSGESSAQTKRPPRNPARVLTSSSFKLLRSESRISRQQFFTRAIPEDELLNDKKRTAKWQNSSLVYKVKVKSSPPSPLPSGFFVVTPIKNDRRNTLDIF